MENKLYVGNIPFQASDEDLKTHFDTVAPVSSAKIIFDKFNNRSKGFGFVEFDTEEQARSALAELDGKELHGRPLRVSVAKARTDRPAR